VGDDRVGVGSENSAGLLMTDPWSRGEWIAKPCAIVRSPNPGSSADFGPEKLLGQFHGYEVACRFPRITIVDTRRTDLVVGSLRWWGTRAWSWKVCPPLLRSTRSCRSGSTTYSSTTGTHPSQCWAGKRLGRLGMGHTVEVL